MRPDSPPAEAPDRPREQAELERCRAGDHAAIEAFFHAHARTVERVIGRLVGPTPDLEDLVQTVFLHALQSLGRFRGEASLKTWMTSIAVHVAQHHLRAGKVRRHVPLEVVAEERLPTYAPDAPHRLDERKLAPRLHALLDRITAPKRVALLLFVVEGYSVEEIASLMGASSTATRSRLFFARRELRALLSSEPELAKLAAGLLDHGEGSEP